MFPYLYISDTGEECILVKQKDGYKLEFYNTESENAKVFSKGEPLEDFLNSNLN